MEYENLDTLMQRIRQCQACAGSLPCPPNPVLRVGSTRARILIIGQAPGTQAHRTTTPWNDVSGDRLRHWMGVTQEQFTDTAKIAIMPMGFCYPGTGAGGDLPPRPECAPLWHDQILKLLPNIQLTLLIGRYAQARYLGRAQKATLRDTVQDWRRHLMNGYLPLVHPSPRNQRWLKNHPWFEQEIVPVLRQRILELMDPEHG